MQLVKYGITLQTLTHEDLEMVRHWRNQDRVRLNMEFQEVIDAEAQQVWFKNLKKSSHLYFIITKGQEKIGVVNLKNIDLENACAEAGIFIGEIAHLNSLSPLLATVSIMELAFGELRLKTLLAKIASDNRKAILFNEALGYKKSGVQTSDKFLYYQVTADQFTEATKTIRSTLNKLTADDYKLIADSEEKQLFQIR